MRIQKSYMAPYDMKKQWYCINGEDQVLGRLAVEVANILMGKHRPTYTPHLDTGDFVIVTNCKKIKVTGKKLREKVYYSWTGYPGGLRTQTLLEKSEKHPTEPLLLAVRRMLPKSTLGHHMLTKLKLYPDDTHPHAAQCPQVWKNLK